MSPEPQWPPLPSHSGFRYECVHIDQAPGGMVPPSVHPALEKMIDRYRDGPQKNPDAVSLLEAMAKRRVAEKDNYWIPRAWIPRDIDGDGRDDFYFYREYEKDTYGLELFLTSSIPMLAALDPDRFERMMMDISDGHRVNIVFASDMIFSTLPSDARDTPEAILERVRPGFVVRRESMLQRQLTRWNAMNGPDGILILDPDISPEQFSADLLPHQTSFDIAVKFVLDQFIDRRSLLFLEDTGECNGGIDTVSFPMSVDGVVMPEEVTRWQKTIADAFDLFVEATPEGCVLGDSTALRSIQFIVSADIEATLARFQGHTFDPETLKSAVALSIFLPDPDGSRDVGSVVVLINVNAQKGDETRWGFAHEPGLYRMAVMIKEFNNILHYATVGGATTSVWHNQWNSVHYHLRAMRRLIHSLRKRGQNTEAESYERYVKIAEERNRRLRFELVQDAIMHHAW